MTPIYVPVSNLEKFMKMNESEIEINILKSLYLKDQIYSNGIQEKCNDYIFYDHDF